MLREPAALNCLLIKPVGPDCNCRCTYCFYLEKAKLFSTGRHLMSEEMLRLIIGKALGAGARPFTFIWQGGEPTLAGLPFFRKAVELQKEYAPDGGVFNALQSNGLPLDENWAAFLAENGFLTGLSLDGPEDMHNAHRLTVGGEGTWSAVMAVAQRLRKAGAMLNALCCVSRLTERRAREIYRFFKESGFSHLQCIPLWETDANGMPRSFSVTPEGYGEFLVELFDEWRDDNHGGRLSIRQFDTLSALLAGEGAAECGIMRHCGGYLAVEHDGMAYPCDFFVHPAHALGNARDCDLAGLLNSEKQRRFGGAKARLPERCAGCKWIGLCNGGCLKYRAFPAVAGGKAPRVPEYVFCESMRRFFAHALPERNSR